VRPAIAYVWGIGGTIYVLIHAILGLYPRAVVAWGMEWSTLQWCFAVIWLIFMAYTEGYRGFQRRFSPRVIARAFYLARNPRLSHLLFAPFFCMGYFFGTRRRLIVSWSLTFGIVLVVQIVRLLEQPWRGILDMGVVLGLAWGTASLLYFSLRLFLDGGTSVDPQIPSGSALDSRAESTVD